MPLQKLEHYLVLSDDIEQTKEFYCGALGMTAGFRPELDYPGYWLYVGGVPCIHVAEWRSYAVWTKEVGIPVSTRARGTGPVDHIAFNATGYDEMRARLESRGIGMSTNHLDDIGLRQLFLYDPNGVAIEINFKEVT
jgi:catechol 2,3-dioxygenase-like lactoylglutathione lyase family enzyme